MDRPIVALQRKVPSMLFSALSGLSTGLSEAAQHMALSPVRLPVRRPVARTGTPPQPGAVGANVACVGANEAKVSAFLGDSCFIEEFYLARCAWCPKSP
jgi:hypothetical protein